MTWGPGSLAAEYAAALQHHGLLADDAGLADVVGHVAAIAEVLSVSQTTPKSSVIREE
jgi:hypothetical protein